MLAYSVGASKVPRRHSVWSVAWSSAALGHMCGNARITCNDRLIAKCCVSNEKL
jgi:hypothetical protein